ncbi:metal-sensitive transcriptional regulator [Lentzea sp. NPDC059081]|uniref:metal-sensitive transcriptional regulator n=1 Tax=Lentzea sp. NPDC059081 TaxID=3346719 RepID=UPI003696B449
MHDDTSAEHLASLRRAEGQVRDVERMVREDAYCIDVLRVTADICTTLRSVSLGLLDDHVQRCVGEALSEGGEEADHKLAEASAAIARLVRS